MAQRKKDVRDACKFELTDKEIKQLIEILDNSAKHGKTIDLCRQAARWRVFFRGSFTMKRGEFAEYQILEGE